MMGPMGRSLTMTRLALPGVAAPPDVLKINEKNLREYYVPNCCSVVITSNYKTDGIYLPEDDRRHYVAYSELTKEDFSKAYWDGIWNWYDDGGYGHVAAYLATLDISSFAPMAPPARSKKQPTFSAIFSAPAQDRQNWPRPKPVMPDTAQGPLHEQNPGWASGRSRPRYTADGYGNCRRMPTTHTH
jgi:hypothetical protein